MAWHGYIYIENIGMNAAQNTELVTALRALGNQEGAQPHLITQYRARLDNEAAILEAEFADNDLTLPSLKGYLANVFGIDPVTIDHAPISNQYGDGVTLSRLGTDYLRFGIFGGAGSERESSRLAATAYLADFAELWDGPDDPPESEPAELTVSALVADPLREKEDRVIDFPDAGELREKEEQPIVTEWVEAEFPVLEAVALPEVDEPAPLPQGTRLIFGRPVKLYDPEFAPTAAVLRLVNRVRNG